MAARTTRQKQLSPFDDAAAFSATAFFTLLLSQFQLYSFIACSPVVFSLLSVRSLPRALRVPSFGD